MKALLLNSTYEAISFVDFRKAILLYVKDKVEVLSVWDEEVNYINGSFKFPAVLRLKYRVKHKQSSIKFSRTNVFRRDKYACQYCGKKNRNKLTIDHITPKSKNGKDSWGNCVTACVSCNYLKGNKTLEEAGLELLSIPSVPNNRLKLEYLDFKTKHVDWDFYF